MHRELTVRSRWPPPHLPRSHSLRAGHAGGRLHAAGRHAGHPGRRRPLRRLHGHPEAEDHGRRRQRRHAQRLQRRPRLPERHRQHLAPHRVPHHARHHPRDRHRQLAQRQLHLPPQVRLRAVQPRRLDDARLVGRGSACSRRRGSTSRKRLPLPLPGHGLRGSRRLPLLVRRRGVVPLQLPRQLRRRPRRLLQRRELQPRRAQRSEGVPCPRHGPAAAGWHPALRGLRVTGFYDTDAYVKDAERRRGIVAVTFEHPYVNAAFEYLATDGSDRATAGRRSTAEAMSVWVTPKTPQTGGKGCCGSTTSSRDTDAATRARETAHHRRRAPTGSRIRAPSRPALLFDFEQVDNNDFAPARADERRYRGARADEFLKSCDRHSSEDEMQ